MRRREWMEFSHQKGQQHPKGSNMDTCWGGGLEEKALTGPLRFKNPKRASRGPKSAPNRSHEVPHNGSKNAP